MNPSPSPTYAHRPQKIWSEQGQTLAEYSLLIVLISVLAVFSSLTIMGNNLTNLLLLLGSSFPHP